MFKDLLSKLLGVAPLKLPRHRAPIALIGCGFDLGEPTHRCTALRTRDLVKKFKKWGFACPAFIEPGIECFKANPSILTGNTMGGTYTQGLCDRRLNLWGQFTLAARHCLSLFQVTGAYGPCT